MVELRMRDRDGESRREYYGGYEWTGEIRAQYASLSVEDPVWVLLPTGSVLVPDISLIVIILAHQVP
jgi:hypothetical protein